MLSSSLLLMLSDELLHCILTDVEACDLAALRQSCRLLSSYIRGNRLLHRSLYLRRYDEPPRPLSGLEPDWEQQLHHLVHLEKILASSDKTVKRKNLAFVADQINLLTSAATSSESGSKNIKLLVDAFEDQGNVSSILCASSLFGRAGDGCTAAESVGVQQQSAKLHCLYGVPIGIAPRNFLLRPGANPSLSPSASTRSQTHQVITHTYARSAVYDLRKYTDNTLWGPFQNDGSHMVDWERMEAIMIVIGFNLNRFTHRSDGRFPSVWKDPWNGATPNSYHALEPKEQEKDVVEEQVMRTRELQLALDAQDPYGVSGTWMRIVCFLDYNDLYAFNFSEQIPDDQLREPIDYDEAIRLIRLKLHVTHIEPPGSCEDGEEDGLDWSNFKGQRLPVVHFRGTSRSLHVSWDPNANSHIRGTVRQTPEGEVRWTSFSIFHGEERWRSEGIQVGGPRSARGVLGSWFDKDFDEHGPAGPTAFWKVAEDATEEKRREQAVWLPWVNLMA